jgi:hypothetical protein
MSAVARRARRLVAKGIAGTRPSTAPRSEPRSERWSGGVMMPEERPRLGERFGAVKIFTAAEIMADELPPVPWVVRDTLQHRCTTS